MMALYTVARWGKAGHLTQEVERLLGRAPISLEQFIKDFRAVWNIKG
jgi:hypothetical protein